MLVPHRPPVPHRAGAACVMNTFTSAHCDNEGCATQWPMCVGPEDSHRLTEIVRSDAFKQANDPPGADAEFLKVMEARPCPNPPPCALRMHGCYHGSCGAT